MNDKLEDSEDLCCPVLVHWIWPLPVDRLTHCVGGGKRGAEEEEKEDCASLTPVFPWQGLALRAVIAKEGRKRRVFESRPRSQLRHRAQGSHLLLSQQGAWLATNVQWEARSAIDRFPASLACGRASGLGTTTRSAIQSD